jgi:hypothetical protein
MGDGWIKTPKFGYPNLNIDNVNKIVLLLLFSTTFFLTGCPKDEPQPSTSDNRVKIPSNGIRVTFSNSQYDPQSDKNTLTDPPTCGGPPIERQNIKFSVKAATKEESPSGQNCSGVHNNYGYFYVGKNNAFVSDVSYYSGINVVDLEVIQGCGSNSIEVFIYDMQGKLIESKTLPERERSGFQMMTFSKDLANLKEIRFVNLCEGGIARISLR